MTRWSIFTPQVTLIRPVCVTARGLLTDVTHVTVLVADADEALAFHTETLSFEKRADEGFAPGMCWVTVAPEGGKTELVLQEPTEAFFGGEKSGEAPRANRAGNGHRPRHRRLP